MEQARPQPLRCWQVTRALPLGTPILTDTASWGTLRRWEQRGRTFNSKISRFQWLNFGISVCWMYNVESRAAFKRPGFERGHLSLVCRCSSASGTALSLTQCWTTWQEEKPWVCMPGWEEYQRSMCLAAWRMSWGRCCWSLMLINWSAATGR